MNNQKANIRKPHFLIKYVDFHFTKERASISNTSKKGNAKTMG